MHLIILKTNIQTQSMVNAITPVFDDHPEILSWSVDTEDIDNVLRIESSEDLTEQKVLRLLVQKGYSCEKLPD